MVQVSWRGHIVPSQRLQRTTETHGSAPFILCFHCVSLVLTKIPFQPKRWLKFFCFSVSGHAQEVASKFCHWKNFRFCVLLVKVIAHLAKHQGKSDPILQENSVLCGTKCFVSKSEGTMNFALIVREGECVMVAMQDQFERLGKGGCPWPMLKDPTDTYKCKDNW